jgi:hypothetical protein
MMADLLEREDLLMLLSEWKGRVDNCKETISAQSLGGNVVINIDEFLSLVEKVITFIRATS